MAPDIYFPELGCALVVRKHCPRGGRFVTNFDAQKSVYLVHTETPPRGARVAEKLLGGWNYPSGECIVLLYAYKFTNMTLFCEREGAEKLVRTHFLPDGRFVNLVRLRTGMDISIGSTPVLAEQELAEDEE